MGLEPSDRALVEQVTAAMQAGRAGQETMMSLFTTDAELIEPFSGVPRTHAGIAAIRERYAEMVAEPRPPDFQLLLDRVDTDGETVVAEWHCTSVVLPAPMLGESRYTIEGGKIRRLEIRILPPAGGR